MEESVQLYWVLVAMAMVHLMIWKCNNIVSERVKAKEQDFPSEVNAEDSQCH